MLKDNKPIEKNNEIFKTYKRRYFRIKENDKIDIKAFYDI